MPVVREGAFMIRQTLTHSVFLAVLVVGSNALAQVVVSIAVAPPALSPTGNVKVGATEQMIATATFADGSTQNVTSLATWGALDPTTAIVSNASGSQGLVSGLRQGKTSVYATYSGAVGGTAIPVGVTSLALKPGAVSRGSTCPPPSTYFPSCSTVQFTATGAFDDGTTTDVTSTVTWSSSKPTVINVGNNGLATYAAYLPGPAVATITATLANLTATANVTISGHLKTRG
jgi:hypothetical protein